LTVLQRTFQLQLQDEWIAETEWKVENDLCDGQGNQDPTNTELPYFRFGTGSCGNATDGTEGRLISPVFAPSTKEVTLDFRLYLKN